MKLSELKTLLDLSVFTQVDCNDMVCWSFSSLWELEDDKFLVGICGRGPTAADARVDYAKKLAGKRVKIDDDRKLYLTLPEELEP